MFRKAGALVVGERQVWGREAEIHYSDGVLPAFVLGDASWGSEERRGAWEVLWGCT